MNFWSNLKWLERAAGILANIERLEIFKVIKGVVDGLERKNLDEKKISYLNRRYVV